MENTVDNTLGHAVRGFLAYHAKRIAKPTGDTSWRAWVYEDTFEAGRIVDGPAPEVARATCEFNLPCLASFGWNWPEHFSLEDMIAIVSDHDVEEIDDRLTPFGGFIVDVDWTFDSSQKLTVTAASLAYRLRRDAQYMVYGRYMYDKSLAVQRFSGLPCVFNAGGKPNRHANPHINSPGTLVYLFTYDDDPDGEYWTPTQILEYLQWMHNTDQTWLTNHYFTGADIKCDERVEVAVEGVSLWEAFGVAGDRLGYDIFERFTNVDGFPASSLVCLRRHTGPELVIDHQPVDSAGSFPTVDIDKTNLFSASVAESVTSCIAAPIVAGGVDLYEVTVELGKAWDSSRLDATGIVYANVDDQPTVQYVKRYTTSGSDFRLWSDVGRLWDANTDGRYSGTPYSLTIADMAQLAGQAAGTWPQMPYKPRPCITRIAASAYASTAERLVEITFDGGTNWYPLSGYKVLPDRLGVWISTKNLAALTKPGGNQSTENLFYMLANSPASVKLRLTCTVAGPNRNIVTPERRSSAGTMFSQSAFYDRGALGQARTIAAGSRFSGASLAADTVTETDADAALAKLASSVQDFAEDRSIEAAIPIEWPDPAIEIGYQITEIRGIAYPLRTSAGAAKRYPRVVGRTLLLTPDSYATQLTLDTDRKAGLT